jgi:hypothetical protein
MTEEILEKLRITAIEPAPQADVAWGLRAGVETQPAAGGTRACAPSGSKSGGHYDRSG